MRWIWVRPPARTEGFPLDARRGVLIEHLRDEVSEVRRECLVQRGRGGVEDVRDELRERGSDEWRAPRGHLVEDAAQRPDVRLGRVHGALHEELGRHIARCPVLGGREELTTLPLSVYLRQLTREPESAELDATVLVEENVRRLQVAVDEALRVQIQKRGGQVAAKVVDRGLRELLVLLQQREERTADAVLKDQPQMVRRLVPRVKVEDLGIVQDVHCLDLLKDPVQGEGAERALVAWSGGAWLNLRGWLAKRGTTSHTLASGFFRPI